MKKLPEGAKGNKLTKADITKKIEPISKLYKFLNSKNINDSLHLNNLGPEPLEKEFNFIYFTKFIKNRNKRSVKKL